jgi:hypothetical protein
MLGSCEHCNELSGSIKGGEFLEQLKDLSLITEIDLLFPEIVNLVYVRATGTGLHSSSRLRFCQQLFLSVVTTTSCRHKRINVATPLSVGI